MAIAVAYPHAGQQARRIAYGPAIAVVVRRAGLDRRGAREAQRAIHAERLDARGVVSRDVANHEGEARVARRPAGGWRALLGRPAARVLDAKDGVGRNYVPAIGERLIGSG